MKQSKIITDTHHRNFDKAVADACTAGWKLIKSEVHYVKPQGFFEYYAELEKGEGAPSKAYVTDLIERLQNKNKTYRLELLEEAADALEALLDELDFVRCCDTCHHRRVDVNAAPCLSCYRASNWEVEGGDS